MTRPVRAHFFDMEQQFTHRDLVIKVKYGDTLRRISASVNENPMDHTMCKLRAKIIHFFKFSNDNDFILSYIDEDGETVTLDNDDELRDAIGQRLNPLRINVHLKSPQSDTLPTVDEPLKSTPEPFINVLANLLNVAQNIISSSPAVEVVKSEPFRSAMESLSKDVKKAASFSPILAQVVDHLSNPGKTCESTGDSLGGASTHLVDLNVVDEPKASTEPVVETTELSANKSTGKDKDVASCNYEECASATFATSSSVNVGTWTPIQTFPSYIDIPVQTYPSYTDIHANTMSGDSRIKPSQYGFSDVPFARQIGLPGSLYAPPMHPYMRSHIYNEYEYTPQTFHRGVQCDGCGMHPIVGPRFKSNLKEDYDLCNFCFAQMGNENDYTKIERASHRAPRPAKQLQDHRYNILASQQKAPHCCGGRKVREKLESRFVQDVTVLDGTVMHPMVYFTKIWRMCNNGSVLWPFGTQLVWVGGDRFGDRTSVDLEIPESGFPVDKELDIAVDFMAPSTVGRYVSYWRMSSPSGQRFGQKVWVNIQVEKSLYPDINLNLPPESNGHNGSVIIDVNAEPLDTTATDSLIDLSVTHSTVEGTLMKVLEEMGFTQMDLNKEILRRYKYDLEKSVLALCDLSEWDALPSDLNAMVSELNHMGFDNKELNKKMLLKNGGSIKRAALDLIAGKME